MDTMEALLTRRSIRKYRPEPVSIEDLKEILAAGATAPPPSICSTGILWPYRTPPRWRRSRPSWAAWWRNSSLCWRSAFPATRSRSASPTASCPPWAGRRCACWFSCSSRTIPIGTEPCRACPPPSRTCCWRPGPRASAPAGCPRPSVWASALRSSAASPPTRGSSWQRSPWATPTSSPKCRPGGTAAI